MSWLTPKFSLTHNNQRLVVQPPSPTPSGPTLPGSEYDFTQTAGSLWLRQGGIYQTVTQYFRNQVTSPDVQNSNIKSGFSLEPGATYPQTIARVFGLSSVLLLADRPVSGATPWGAYLGNNLSAWHQNMKYERVMLLTGSSRPASMLVDLPTQRKYWSGPKMKVAVLVARSAALADCLCLYACAYEVKMEYRRVDFTFGTAHQVQPWVTLLRGRMLRSGHPNGRALVYVHEDWDYTYGGSRSVILNSLSVRRFIAHLRQPEIDDLVCFVGVKTDDKGLKVGTVEIHLPLLAAMDSLLLLEKIHNAQVTLGTVDLLLDTAARVVHDRSCFRADAQRPLILYN
jgi:hypothetical protein